MAGMAGFGTAYRGWVRRGEARFGWQGPAWSVPVRRGQAWCGMAGSVGRGKVWQGSVGRGRHGAVWQAWQGLARQAWRGVAGSGVVRSGEAGMARLGPVMFGLEWSGEAGKADSKEI